MDNQRRESFKANLVIPKSAISNLKFKPDPLPLNQIRKSSIITAQNILQ